MLNIYTIQQPRRFAVIFALLLSWSPAAARADDLSPSQLRQQRSAAAHRPRRIIFNNDGNDPWTTPDVPRTHENFLNRRTSTLANTQVDAIFYCSGVFNFYSHHSPETELLKKERDGLLHWGWELGARGPDTLETMIRFGHEHKMEVFWSMRMNDCHDSTDPVNLSQWKKDHSDWLVSKKGQRFPAGAGRWSALNYAVPEVRDKVFRILDDVATRYDVDGLELDFFRSPVYFQPQIHAQPVTQAHCDMMTDLLRRVRETADRQALRRGRPLLIAVRVPDSVEYCHGLGLDLVRWLDEGLIDILAVGCMFQLNPYEASTALGHKYNVPVYPSLSESRFKDPEAKALRATDAAYRGRALEAWSAGADGIYMFNFTDPQSPLWRELGDPQKLLTREHCYTTGYTDTKGSASWLANGTKFLNLPAPLPEKPLTLKPNTPTKITLRTGPTPIASPPATNGVPSTSSPPLTKGGPGGANSQAISPRVVIQLRFPKPPPNPSLIEVKLNGHPAAPGTQAGQYTDYPADSTWLHAHRNQIELTLNANAPAPLTLQDLILRIIPTNAPTTSPAQ